MTVILIGVLVAAVAVSMLLGFQARLSARELVGQTSVMLAAALALYGLVVLLSIPGAG